MCVDLIHCVVITVTCLNVRPYRGSIYMWLSDWLGVYESNYTTRVPM